MATPENEWTHSLRSLAFVIKRRALTSHEQNKSGREGWGTPNPVKAKSKLTPDLGGRITNVECNKG